MRVAVLVSSARQDMSSRVRVRSLESGLEALGVEYILVDPATLSLYLGGPGAEIPHRGLHVSDLDLVLNTISSSEEPHLHPYVRQFEMASVPVVNPLSGWLASGQKDATLQLLWRRSIPMPRTVIATLQADLEMIAEFVGGVPVVVKRSRGLKGRGVFICESLRSLRSTLQSLMSTTEPVIFQEFIAEADGRDYKITITRDSCLCAVQRVATVRSEFRANVALGGHATLVKPEMEMVELAKQAIDAVGLIFGSVDIIKSRAGLLVIDVNDFPELNLSYGDLDCFVELNYTKLFVAHLIRAACPRANVSGQEIDGLCRSLHNPRIAGKEDYYRRIKRDQVLVFNPDSKL